MSSEKRSSLLASATSVTILLFISKIFGFVRERIILTQFGATIETDAYTLAYKIPYFAQTVITAALVAVFIPTYTNIQAHKGKESADRFANNILGITVCLTSILAIFCYLFNDALIGAIGFTYKQYGQVFFDMASNMSMIMMPLMIFAAFMVVFQNLLNAHKRHAPAQLIGFPFSISIIVFALVFSGTLGTYALAWGTLVGVFLQAVILWLFVRKSFRVRPYIDLKDPYIRKAAALMVPAIISVAAADINTLADTMLSGTVGQGAATSLNAAWRLINLVVGTISVAVTTVLFTRLSQHASENDMDSFRHVCVSGITNVSVVLAPIVIVCCVMSVDITTVAYKGGELGDGGVRMIASAFLFYSPAIMATALRDIMVRSFFSLGDTKTPLINGVIAVVLNIILNIVLVQVMGLGGLALATSISLFASGILSARALSRRVGGLGIHTMFGQFIKVAICMAVQVAVMLLLTRIAAGMGTLLRLIVCAGGGLVAYLLAGFALRLTALQDGLAMLRRRSQ